MLCRLCRCTVVVTALRMSKGLAPSDVRGNTLFADSCSSRRSSHDKLRCYGLNRLLWASR